MPLFHATLRENLPSIYRHGLGGGVYKQLWEGCEPGVYLASEPYSCIWVMIEQYIQYGDPTSIPKDHLANMCIIVIDETRIDVRKLAADPLLPKVGIYRYTGIIDVTNQAVISVADVEMDRPELQSLDV